MTTFNLFSGSITIKVKGSAKKFTWAHEFSPSDLSFQDSLVPIFIKDITIPESERGYLTKDVRKMLLQIKNIKPSQWTTTCAEINAFIKSQKGKIKIEAKGIGAYIVSHAVKGSSVAIDFYSYEFPFLLLDKNFQKRVVKKPHTMHLYYREETPFKNLPSLMGPKYKWWKSSKSLVA